MTLRCVVRCVVLVIAVTRDWQTVATKKVEPAQLRAKVVARCITDSRSRTTGCPIENEWERL